MQRKLIDSIQYFANRLYICLTWRWRLVWKPAIVVFFNKKDHVKINDLTFFIDKRDRSISHDLLSKGNYEEDKIKHLCSLVFPDDFVIDVGAHIGLHAIRYSKKLGKFGRVVAVEPAPDTIRYLEKNIDVNQCQNIAIERCAINNELSEVLIYINKNSSAWQGEIDFCGQGKAMSVCAKRLDAIIEEYGSVTPRLLKIDIEGSEYKAIMSLGKYRPDIISFEFNPWKIGLNNHNPRQLLVDMVNLGYKLDVLCGPENMDWTIDNLYRYACREVSLFREIDVLATYQRAVL